MAIRIRTVDGVRVALCAAETDAAAGDIYLDDSDHYALAAKVPPRLEDSAGYLAGLSSRMGSHGDPEDARR